MLNKKNVQRIKEIKKCNLSVNFSNKDTVYQKKNLKIIQANHMRKKPINANKIIQNNFQQFIESAKPY